MFRYVLWNSKLDAGATALPWLELLCCFETLKGLLLVPYPMWSVLSIAIPVCFELWLVRWFGFIPRFEFIMCSWPCRTVRLELVVCLLQLVLVNCECVDSLSYWQSDSLIVIKNLDPMLIKSCTSGFCNLVSHLYTGALDCTSCEWMIDCLNWDLWPLYTSRVVLFYPLGLFLICLVFIGSNFMSPILLYSFYLILIFLRCRRFIYTRFAKKNIKQIYVFLEIWCLVQLSINLDGQFHCSLWEGSIKVRIKSWMKLLLVKNILLNFYCF